MTEKKTILLEIFQPFAQYRNPFTFYYAQSYPLPPKSTIIGMLQNATGKYYRLGREFWDLEVSVHGGFESVFWNYQSLIKGNISLVRYGNNITLWNQEAPLYGKGRTSQRTPVYQQELFNGYLYIFLRGEEDKIDEVKEFLLNPQKILYLGRSEDVIFIKNIYSEDDLKIRNKEVKRSIWLKYPMYIKYDNFPIENQKFPVYSIPVKVTFKTNGVEVSNKAKITKATDRDVRFETVIYTGLEYVIYLSKNKDIGKFTITEIKSPDNPELIFKIPEPYGWL